MAAPRVSIVIPALDEAECLPRTLASLAAQAGGVAREIIVVDGGSRDGTLRAAALGADRVLTSPPGRAAQMNHGAAAARGDVLLFLHADTTLSPDALKQVDAAMRVPGVAGGTLRLGIADAGPLLTAIAWGVNLRSRLLRLPYGDQGIFLHRERFEELGGYRELPMMEDVDLVRRLRRTGRMVLLPAFAVTSGRRWRANGVARTTLCNWAAVALFAAGVPAARIRPWYDRLLHPREAPQPHERRAPACSGG